jgi:hypothetical protein
VISYGNLSGIEQGKAGELRQRAFWQLWELNRRIASGDWGHVGDAELRRKLEGAIPLGDDAAPVWGPLEFSSCYCGLRPVPPAFASTPAPLIGARQAAALSSRWRRQLQALIEEHALDAAAALDALMATLLASASTSVHIHAARRLRFSASSDGLLYWLIEECWGWGLRPPSPVRPAAAPG